MLRGKALLVVDIAQLRLAADIGERHGDDILRLAATGLANEIEHIVRQMDAETEAVPAMTAHIDVGAGWVDLITQKGGSDA
jgi:hypothetical protein